jgi:hypothetical protein
LVRWQHARATNHCFLVQPSTTKVGAPISPAVQVEVRYPGDDHAVTTWSTPITIYVQDGPIGTELSGTTTRTPVNGKVTFDNLAIGRAFSGYRLYVASGVIPGVLSERFTIVP